MDSMWLLVEGFCVFSIFFVVCSVNVMNEQHKNSVHRVRLRAPNEMR